MHAAVLFLRRTARALSLALTSGALPACGDDHEGGEGDSDAHTEEEESTGTPSGAECPPDSTLTYETFGRDFMDMYCVRCHSSELQGTARNGAPEGHDFDRLEGILPVAEHVDAYAAAGPDAVNTRMPPTPPRPTEEERSQLGEWLACEQLDGPDAGMQ